MNRLDEGGLRGTPILNYSVEMKMLRGRGVRL